MTIFDYFFSCFKFIIKVLDNDFFGLGFSYLDFMLGASIALLILNFLLKGFNDFDRFNMLSIMDNGEDFGRALSMSNKEREKQITKKSSYVGSDYIDVWGDGTYVVSKEQYYGKD